MCSQCVAKGTKTVAVALMAFVSEALIFVDGCLDILAQVPADKRSTVYNAMVAEFRQQRKMMEATLEAASSATEAAKRNNPMDYASESSRELIKLMSYKGHRDDNKGPTIHLLN